MFPDPTLDSRTHDLEIRMPQKKKGKTKSAKSAPRRNPAKAKPAARKAPRRAAGQSGKPMPSVKAQFLDSFQREHAITSKVLRAMPSDQTEFRPHIRAGSARELAFTFVMELKLLTKAITGEPFFGGPRAEPPTDYRAIVDQFESDYGALVDLI